LIDLSDFRIMVRLIVLLTILVAYQAQARFGRLRNDRYSGHTDFVAKEPKMELVFRSVDVTDRTTEKWWDDLNNLFAEYKIKVADGTAYCLIPDKLLADLDVQKDAVDLVKSGLDALKEQIVAVKGILADTTFNEKSGLHCDGADKETEDICVALDELDTKLEQQLAELAEDLKDIEEEITKVKNYPCDCEYKDWVGAWGECMSDAGVVITCGEGFEHESREIKWPLRNGGKACDPADAKQKRPCDKGCCPVDCKWKEWEQWQACPQVCSSDPLTKKQTRIREVEIPMSCGGNECDNISEEKKDCDILKIHKAEIEKLKEEKCKAPVVVGGSNELKPVSREPGFKLSAPNADCASTCGQLGLICTPNGLKNQIDQVATSEALLDVIKTEEGPLTNPKTGDVITKCAQKKKPGPAAPAFTMKGECVLPPPKDSIDFIDCSAKGLPEKKKKRRVCYCEKCRDLKSKEDCDPENEFTCSTFKDMCLETCGACPTEENELP